VTDLLKPVRVGQRFVSGCQLTCHSLNWRLSPSFLTRPSRGGGVETLQAGWPVLTTFRRSGFRYIFGSFLNPWSAQIFRATISQKGILIDTNLNKSRHLPCGWAKLVNCTCKLALLKLHL
jgi:hypothetical protein